MIINKDYIYCSIIRPYLIELSTLNETNCLTQNMFLPSYPPPVGQIVSLKAVFFISYPHSVGQIVSLKRIFGENQCDKLSH